MINSEKIGKRLQQVMDKEDLTAASFAEQIDVGRATISHILSGRNNPSLDVVMKVCQTFKHVHLDWLLEGKGTYPSTENELTSSRQKAPAVPEVENLKSTKNTSTIQLPSENENPSASEKISIVGEPKEIRKIITMYTDGTFDAFYPNKE